MFQTCLPVSKVQLTVTSNRNAASTFSVSFQMCVCTCFLKTLVGILLSFVCGRLRGGCCGPPTAFPVRAPVYRGCPCRDPPVCHRVQGDSVAKRQPFLVLGVVTSCVHCARIPRVSRDGITTGFSSCAAENTYTNARLETLVKLSVVILSHSYHFPHIFLRVVGAPSNSSSRRNFLAC